ncbi:C6 transcription factor, putative [Trichophyton verrucosum HKI 0517]|uniref:C6 transcription factor, putative n=1 Tax=Trichophyton verrucosum (strain HKI 0517) TaxID=663202 RepID=D4D7L1_TRIVH|nr:C6 transcription factor, putative [Trichophyton verrucosum HKI 0517]EFE42179.1 C6 transcription factor, putative [Trichophyton verrucosum HKI 0517]
MSSSSSPRMSSLSDSNDSNAIRKRVGKACDRCRLKKSKCDGDLPCARCSADNVVCVYGERKRTHDKTYPKGYVELLEHQQTSLVFGIQEMYKLLIKGNKWPGQPLNNSHNGHPLTHDILERLGALNVADGPANAGLPRFEEDLEAMQAQLLRKSPERAQVTQHPGRMELAEQTDTMGLLDQPEKMDLEEEQGRGESMDSTSEGASPPSHATESSSPSSLPSPVLEDTFVIDSFPQALSTSEPHQGHSQLAASLQQLYYAQQQQQQQDQQTAFNPAALFSDLATARSEGIVSPQNLQLGFADALLTFDQMESIQSQYVQTPWILYNDYSR